MLSCFVEFGSARALTVVCCPHNNNTKQKTINTLFTSVLVIINIDLHETTESSGNKANDNGMAGICHFVWCALPYLATLLNY